MFALSYELESRDSKGPHRHSGVRRLGFRIPRDIYERFYFDDAFVCQYIFHEVERKKARVDLS